MVTERKCIQMFTLCITNVYFMYTFVIRFWCFFARFFYKKIKKAEVKLFFDPYFFIFIYVIIFL